MRIWDIPVKKLCRNHLLGEHRELHAIWSIITQRKKGYAHHPETLRWVNKLKALYLRHEKQVQEMKRRCYRHYSALEHKLAKGKSKQDITLHTVKDQIKILKHKKCSCKI